MAFAPTLNGAKIGVLFKLSKISDNFIKIIVQKFGQFRAGFYLCIIVNLKQQQQQWNLTTTNQMPQPQPITW